MPNWCEGTLKVRGKYEDVKRFLLEGVEPAGESPVKTTPTIEDWGTEVIIGYANTQWIKGSRRHFIDNGEYWTGKREDGSAIVLLDFRAAWGIDTDTLAEISKDYYVDFKIMGLESGMQFVQDVEVTNGTIIKDQEIKYDDWDWECPCPRLGG